MNLVFSTSSTPVPVNNLFQFDDDGKDRSVCFSSLDRPWITVAHNHITQLLVGDDDMTDAKLSFLTQFALHLAASLVGTAARRFNDDDDRRPLYWRTPLLPGDSFADISMTQTSDGQLQLSFGIFRKKQDQHYYYSKGLLQEATLRSHFENLGIDLETTAPSIVAKSMAKALRGIKGDLHDFVSKFTLPLYYEDVDESGLLEIGMESDCALDEATVTMILCNLEQAVQSNTEEDYDASLLEQEFLQRHAKKPTEPTTSSPVVIKPASKPATARPPKSGGVRSVGGNRRKKAKTLSYAK